MEFDDIIMTFTDQNGRPAEIENSSDLMLIINKYRWRVIL